MTSSTGLSILVCLELDVIARLSVTTEPVTITMWSHVQPAPYKTFVSPARHPRFRLSLVPSSFFLFSLLIPLDFLPGAQPGAFFLNQPQIGRQTPIRDSDPANGWRILVPKRVSHRKEARLQRHLLRLTFLLLRVWLVHPGA